jgi:hypothetical protein
MQKLTLLLITIFTFAGLLFASGEPEGITLSKVSGGYLVSFKLPDYKQNIVKAEGEEYIEFQTASYGSVSDVGKPALPLVSFNFAVPYNLDQLKVEVTSRNQQEISLKAKVYPFQEPWEKNKPFSERPFTIDRAYYRTSGEILPFVSVSEDFIIGGVKGFRIVIHPFSYNPSRDLLTVITEGTFKVIVSADEVDSKRSAYYNEYLKDVFVNYDVSGGRGINYLIITAPEFESGLAPFVNHKSSMGFTVDVFNTTATGTTAAAIKTFIQQRYNNAVTKPEFVLLVGDVAKIPAWTGTGTGTPKTDLNYACLEGTDYYADVFLGRFSVTNLTELQNAINKTVYTENYISTIAKKNVYMASTDNYTITEGTHNYVINTYFSPNNYTNLKLYTHTYNATTAQLISALNDNQMFAIYSGHGATTYWADGPQLSQSQVRALTNTVFPFVYSFACVTGDYSNTAECFGETWLRTQTGASSFYGSSVNSYWTEDDILEKVLFKSMFDDNITKVTPMFDKAKIYLVNHFGSLTGMMLRYLEMYNLMGDPSLETIRHITPDQTPPEAITDLSLLDATSGSVTLNWTAPYDSTIGGVTTYDIRYSNNIITEENFNYASQKMLTGQSDSAGVPKSFVLDSLNAAQQYYAAVKAMDMWGNTSAISNSASISTLAAPQIAVSPDSVSLHMTPDSTKTEIILISNICPSPSTLDYTVDLINNTYPGKVTTRLIPVVQPPDKEDVSYTGREEKQSSKEQTGLSFKGSGGPDAFGYKWRDSNEPAGPQYVWNSITTTGTQVTNWIATGSVSPLDDGYSGPIPIGFNFKFYGEVKTQLYINTNGLIVFAPVTGSWLSNASIPSSSDPNAFIAPFWDDLDGKNQGTVHYKQEIDKFIIQFTDWQKYNASTSSFTFQIILHKSGRITYYYNNLNGTVNSSTVGIEGPGGTTGLLVAYNAAYLTNSLAVEFAAEPEWVFINSTSGTITSGSSTQFVLQIESEGLEYGNYSMDVRIRSNCANNPSVIVPVKLLVSEIVPVELASFTAENISDKVIIKWETKTETNNNGFNVERKSVKDAVWQELGFVKGSGTSTESKLYTFEDKSPASGLYKYRLVQFDFDGSRSISPVIEIDITGPDKFELSQNYPNPFNPVTVIKYALPVKSSVRLTVHNLLGETSEIIVNELQESGYYEYQWNASGLASGIYFFRLNAVTPDGKDSYSSVKKMILMK